MLKSPIPVYFCSTVFTIAVFPATDNVMAPLDQPVTAIVHSRKARKATTSKAMKIVMTAPPNTLEMKFVRNYIKRNSLCLRGVKQRSEVPFGIIDSVFNHYHLPHELKYLAVIESELKQTALSPVGAKGPWQLMPATARSFGLKVNRQVDDRMNYYKSTRVAAKYLKQLYHQFGDWLLVLAAYNGGPRPVYAAIHKSHNRNFWKLQHWLPAESRLHVKKFIATDYYFKETDNMATLAMEKPNFPVSVKAFKSAHMNELADERFSRLMHESAYCLQQSNTLLDNN